jgi:hypothetical protein
MSHPSDWIDLLLLSGGWPDPTPGKHDSEKVHRLVEAMDAIAASKAERQQILAARQTFEIVASCLSTLATKLEGLGNINTPASTAFRVLAFVEDQTRLFHEKSRPQGGEAIAVPIAGMSASLSGPWGGQPVSPYQAIEMTIDSAEVVLRYLAHRSGGALPPLERAMPASPYDDPDFQRLIDYAGTWNGYHDLWACVKYQQHERDTKAETATFIPRRPDLLLRRRIGAVRRRNFELEFFSANLHSATSNSDAPAAIQQAIQDVQGPSQWPWRLDIRSFARRLRGLSANTGFARMAADYIEVRSYRKMASSTAIPADLSDDSRIAHSRWLEVVTLLHVVAELAAAVIRRDFPLLSARPDGCLLMVPLLVSSDLETVFSTTLQIPREPVAAILRALTFDPTRKKLEIWEQPLVRFGQEVALTPTLIRNGSPTRAVENLVRQWNRGDVFSLRGGEFHQGVARWMEEEAPGQIFSKKILRLGSSPHEFDIIWIWEKHLFLIEAKCFKMVTDDADAYAAEKEMREAIAQLILRRDLVRRYWDDFRRLNGQDLLPPEWCAECVHAVALLNDPVFSGFVEGDVVVSDEACFKRYFGDPRIYPFVVQPGVPTKVGPAIGSVRDDQEINPSSLMRYLQHPGQVEVWARSMKYGPYVLPPVTEGLGGALAFDFSFQLEPDVAVPPPINEPSK